MSYLSCAPLSFYCMFCAKNTIKLIMRISQVNVMTPTALIDLCFVTLIGLCVLQVYTRSVIDPIPAPVTFPDGDTASKGGVDRQKKKGKMTDEEIMDKLSKDFISSFILSAYESPFLCEIL